MVGGLLIDKYGYGANFVTSALLLALGALLWPALFIALGRLERQHGAEVAFKAARRKGSV